MRLTSYAYRLDSLSVDDLILPLKSVKRFADAGVLVTRLIHSIPSLNEDWKLHQLSVYFGRAPATPEGIKRRFDDSRSVGRPYGLIAFRTATDKIKEMEHLAINAAKRFEELGILCVQNLQLHPAGQLPACPESVLYITWSIDIRAKQRPRCYLPHVTTVANQLALKKFIAGDGVFEHFVNTYVSAFKGMTKPTTEIGRLQWRYQTDP